MGIPQSMRFRGKIHAKRVFSMSYMNSVVVCKQICKLFRQSREVHSARTYTVEGCSYAGSRRHLMLGSVKKSDKIDSHRIFSGIRAVLSTF